MAQDRRGFESASHVAENNGRLRPRSGEHQHEPDLARRASARPNVSMTIMRPPQHGQGSEGLGGTASSSGRDCAAVASNWRARAMFRAQALPANRP